MASTTFSNINLLWIQPFWHADSIFEGILRYGSFWKKIIRRQKSMKLEDLKVLKRSPDLLNNVKIGHGQHKAYFVLPDMGMVAILVKWPKYIYIYDFWKYIGIYTFSNINLLWIKPFWRADCIFEGILYLRSLHMKFEINKPSGFWINFVLIFDGDSNISYIGWKVEGQLWP